MTREEAKEYIMRHCNPDYPKGKMEWDKAINMAISALSQPEVIRCKDCKHRILNENYGKRGYLKIKAMCELDTGDPFELGRDADDDNWYCKDAERRVKE